MKPTQAESPAVLPGDGLVPLESVLCTEELNLRPSRPPDYEKENRVLGALAQALADSPSTILQKMAEIMLETFRADSSGFSVLTKDDGGKRFYWPAISGVWKPHIGGGTPRDFGPCGDVLDRNAPLLFRHFERRYTYFLPVTPPVEECLLVPFYVEGKAVGTIWVIAHDDRREFDAEDLRQLVSLGRFASSAYQAVEFHEKMLAINEALMLGSLRQHELAEAADSLNVELQREITERKRTEALLSCQKQTFEMVAVGVPMLEVLEFLARATEGQSPQQALVAIHLLDESGARFDQTVAPSLPAEYSQAVNGMAVSSTTGSCCAAVAGRRRVVVADIAGCKEWPAFASLALPLGLRAACSTPIFSSSGKVLGSFVTYYREVHEPEPQEALLGEIVTRTAAVVIERKEAEEALRESDRRKSEFLAMLAHELRNPLAPISNALQIMRLKGGDQEAVRSSSEMMERQVGQMVRLVDDLLDVSRISRGTIALHKGRIELASVIHHAVEAARPLYESRDHELTVTLPSKPIYVSADRTRLAQVVGNLLNNACKFTDKGGSISLTVENPSERAEAQAVIRVRDSGIGIAPDELSRIFEMFWQVDTSLVRSASGLGIGLALVRNVVVLHDGTVEVHSAGVGQGSEFVVRLPILVEASELQPPEAAVGEATPTVARRILVVDDNRDAAASLAMLLELTGHETHTAHDGLAAVEAAAAFRPEVILLDIGLPKLNGHEAARKIREEPWGKGMVLIALTGWGQDEDRRKSQEAGFNGHLVKPVEHAALMQMLAEVQSTQV